MKVSGDNYIVRKLWSSNCKQRQSIQRDKNTYNKPKNARVFDDRSRKQ